ncbi:MAG: F0F1 ATP synthase subunit B [Terriglobales bacterium]
MPVVAAASLLTLNFTFVIEIVVFLVLLYVLRRYLWPYLDRAITRRQEQIAQALKEAEQARKDVESSRAAEQTELAEARRHAKEIVDRAQKVGEELRQELRRKGEQEQEAMLRRARADLSREREQALAELRRQASDLVMLATSRVLQEELDPKRQQRLVEAALKEVDLSA